MTKITELEKEIELLKAENEKLKHLIEYYLSLLQNNARKKYGTSSETTDNMQMSLFNEAEAASDGTDDEPSVTEIIHQKRKKKKGKKAEDLSKLITEVVEHKLDEKLCPECGSENVKMINETFKEVTIVPAQLKVTEHRTEVCKCKDCNKEIKPLEAPSRLLAKSTLSPSLAAYIAVQKYAHAQPLERIEKSFHMQGIYISKQNMSNWIIKLIAITDIVVSAFTLELQMRDFLHSDETTVQVHGEINRANTQNSYMWVLTTGVCDDKSIALYKYRDNRRKENPVEILGNYSGYLHCDGYAGYNGLNAKLCGCWAHARRKYAEILKIKGISDWDKEIAKKGFDFCNKIFRLERKFKDLSYEERHENRNEETKPILDEFFVWVEKELHAVISSKSMIYSALYYSKNQRDKLSRFLEDGRIEISNNRAERAVRPFTIGRKNWLFADSVSGAVASGNFYTIIETAKMNNLNPFEYLKYIFEYFRSRGRLSYAEDGNLVFVPKETFDIQHIMPWYPALPTNIKL